MYRDVRPAAKGASTASTPEVWAKTFAASTKMNSWKHFRIGTTLEAKMIRRLVPQGGRILDAGCGFGEWVAYLRSKGYRAFGCDYSSELIRRLRETYPDTEWVQTDIRNMQIEEASVDAIISWGVIEHDEAGPASALREFHRILRPGGHAIVTVPINTPLARASAQYLERRSGGEQTFFQYLMSTAELEEHGRNAGFEVSASGTVPLAYVEYLSPGLVFRLPSLLYRVVNNLFWILFSWMERYRVMTYVVLRKP